MFFHSLPVFLFKNIDVKYCIIWINKRSAVYCIGGLILKGQKWTHKNNTLNGLGKKSDLKPDPHKLCEPVCLQEFVNV